jgi:hypothetical protein
MPEKHFFSKARISEHKQVGKELFPPLAQLGEANQIYWEPEPQLL